MKVFFPLCATVLLFSVTASSATDEKKSSGTTAESKAAEIKDVTPAQAEKLIQERKDVVVLDVRTPDEFTEGHIKGAKNVDAMGDDFDKALKGLDRDQTYLLHCAAGGRSSRVLKKMKELNFKSIYHLPAGLNGWQDAGKPVTK